MCYADLLCAGTSWMHWSCSRCRCYRIRLAMALALVVALVTMVQASQVEACGDVAGSGATGFFARSRGRPKRADRWYARS